MTGPRPPFPCQSCGQLVTVYTADEGTQSYVPAERLATLHYIEEAVQAIAGSSVQEAYMTGAADMRAAVLAAIRSAAPVEPT